MPRTGAEAVRASELSVEAVAAAADEDERTLRLHVHAYARVYFRRVTVTQLCRIQYRMLHHSRLPYSMLYHNILWCGMNQEDLR